MRQRIGVSVEGTLFFLVLEGAFLYNDSINTKDFIYYFVVNTRIWKYNIVKDFKERASPGEMWEMGVSPER